MKNKQPTVNIVILNYNGKEDTIECIESVLKIDYKNYKIILVDNNSLDGSIKEFEDKYSNNKKIKIISNSENFGFAKGNDEAIKNNFNSDYFLLLNNDTIVKKDFLNILVNFAEKNGGAGVIAPLIYKYSERDKLNPNNVPGKFNLKKGGGEPLFKKNHEIKKIKNPFLADYTSGCCWIMRKKVIEECGFFNEKFFAYVEEIDLAMKIKKRGFKFFIVPSSKIWHKGESTSKKISWFRMYYSTRNMIWLERIHATKKEFFIFILNLLFIKIPKNILKILIQKNRIINLKKFMRAIGEGVFTKKNEFDLPKFYLINK